MAPYHLVQAGVLLFVRRLSVVCGGAIGIDPYGRSPTSTTTQLNNVLLYEWCHINWQQERLGIFLQVLGVDKVTLIDNA